MRLPLSTSGYDALMGGILRTLTGGHKWLHRVSGGRAGKSFPGGALVIWVTLPGRKSGVPRLTPLLGAPDGDAWVVAGSAGGMSSAPEWALNAIAAAENPTSECLLEVNGVTRKIRVINLVDEAERSAAYEKLILDWRFFRSYAQRTSRTIPVFRLVYSEGI